MKKYLYYISSLFLLIGFAGCGGAVAKKSYTSPTIYYTPEYNFILESVDVSISKNDASLNHNKLQYKDENIIISFQTKHKYFKFNLENKTKDGVVT